MRFLPDPILRQLTKKIATIPRNLKQYTDDMVETMHDEQGVGLAANQVGSLQRVAVIQLPEWDEPLILINPEIIRREGEREVEEGCLSIPGYRGTVRRSERVRVRALDLSGKLIRIKADGLLAQALEHETDHLHGKLYIDHLVSRDAIWKITYNPQAEDAESAAEATAEAGQAGAPEADQPEASGGATGETSPDSGGQLSGAAQPWPK
jgi:peptide deformylase